MARRAANESDSVYLLEATEEDIELLMAWMSHPSVYQGWYTQRSPLTWSQHRAWWESRRNRKDWIIVFESEGWVRKVGVINVRHLDENVPEIGLYIGETTLMGKGAGRRAMRAAMDWLRTAGYKRCCVLVLDSNVAAQHMHASVGFERVEPGRPGESRWEATL